MFRIINANLVGKKNSGLWTITYDEQAIKKISKQAEHVVKSSRSDYDAQKRIVLPGLIDCHAHLFSVAEKENEVDLRSARSIDDFKTRIRNFMKKHRMSENEWLVGSGWDQDLFMEARYPSKRDLDAIVPDNPAIMARICGHIAVLNSKAIEEMQFLNDIREELVPRDSNGSLHGIVKEQALDECWKHIPESTVKELMNGLLRVQGEALRKGLVAVHTILSSNWKNELEAVRRLDDSRKLLLSLSLFLPISTITHVESLRESEREKFLKGDSYAILGFKLFSDGSLGARTAALIKPYSDDPSNRGILYHSKSEIVDYARRTKAQGLILATHAIGDRAVEQVAESYIEAGIKSNDGFRIEHCSVVEKRTISKLAGITLCVQPSFCTSDYWIPRRLGRTRAKRAYQLKTLLTTSHLIGGSDAPIEKLDPLSGICSAITNPIKSESLTLDEAVGLYTWSAANASPLTVRMGRLAVGCIPNFVLLNINNQKDMCEASVEQVFIRSRELNRDYIKNSDEEF